MKFLLKKGEKLNLVVDDYSTSGYVWRINFEKTKGTKTLPCPLTVTDVIYEQAKLENIGENHKIYMEISLYDLTSSEYHLSEWKIKFENLRPFDNAEPIQKIELDIILCVV